MYEIEKIGNRIKSVRLAYGLTQAAFAKELDVSPGNVGDWESTNKKAVPGAKALISISEAFGVTTDWILKGEVIYYYNGNKHYQNRLEIYNNIASVLKSRNQTLYEFKDLKNNHPHIFKNIVDWSLDRNMVTRGALIDVANYLDVPLEWLETGMPKDNSLFRDMRKEALSDITELISEEEKAMKIESEERKDILLNEIIHNGKMPDDIFDLFNHLSNRDKREIVEIIGIKLRFKEEFKEHNND
ncbi:helix-turn-helix domain-containing protein [Oceanobacillus oncorhynchi]|uniref:helix-turn-helix domain-containing protein n=1 Tax=Oceanobacillus oncorhynchi TaxID=545501 RepID=UPI0034D4C151